MNRFKLILFVLFVFLSPHLFAQTEIEDDTTTEIGDEEYWEDQMEVEDNLVLDSTAKAFFSWMFPTYSGEEPAYKLYKVWDNYRVHPYSFDLDNLEDSTAIVLEDKAMGEKFFCPIKSYVTSEFGPRRRRYHYGIDLGLHVGDSILCPFDGMVRVVRWSQGYGNVIVVRHYNGLETVYGHLSKNFVAPNQEVKAGELLAYGGNTGRSTGPHLHMETRYLGQPMNPRDIIDFSTFTLKQDIIYVSKENFRHVFMAQKARREGRDRHHKDRERGGSKYHKVKSGDTLGHIAAKYGMSVSKLCKLNRISQKKTLRKGQKIRLH